MESTPINNSSTEDLAILGRRPLCLLLSNNDQYPDYLVDTGDCTRYNILSCMSIIRINHTLQRSLRTYQSNGMSEGFCEQVLDYVKIHLQLNHRMILLMDKIQ